MGASTVWSSSFDRCLGHENDLAVTSATSLVPSASSFDHLTKVLIQVFDADLYVTFDGTTPSAGHGPKITQNDIVTLELADADLRKIRGASASTSTVKVTYFGY